MDDRVILKKLFEHDDRFDRIEKKAEDFRDQMLTGMDKMMVVLERLDQERIFTTETIHRVQREVERQQKEIDHIRKVLKIA